MTFRFRLVLALAAAALLPLGLLALGVRRQLGARIAAQHERRVRALVDVAERDLARQSESVALRLRAISEALADDDRIRLALGGAPGERGYLLDWAGRSMRAGGLSMLQLQDGAGRILSSGHFRNEYDRVDAALPARLAAADSLVLVAARTPAGPLLVLARVDSVRIGDRRLTLVGGVAVDDQFLRRFATDAALAVHLVTPDGTVGAARRSSAPARVVGELSLGYVAAGGATSGTAPARLVVSESLAEAEALRADVNGWVAATVATAALLAIALAAWLSTGLSRPIAALARAAASVELDGPQIELASARDDEIGALARRFAAMTRRLRAGAVRLRDAERRATVGEMARQVNHDMKNGLIPIRNVVRHLAEVQETRPAELPAVFGERRATLESSIGFLDALARRYARLTPPLERRPVDVNVVARQVALAAAAGPAAVEARLSPSLPLVAGDPVLLHRILDNLVRNALESLPPAGGRVVVETAAHDGGGVRVAIRDDGCGMAPGELARAFDDFFTTKSAGTGLGLSVVRRLTADLGGSLRVESAPGRGTTFTLELPAPSP